MSTTTTETTPTIQTIFSYIFKKSIVFRRLVLSFTFLKGIENAKIISLKPHKILINNNGIITIIKKPERLKYGNIGLPTDNIVANINPKNTTKESKNLNIQSSLIF
jgi:hypothetical protein